ncbi:MAG: hypothetical protein SAL07_18255 [Oscillatoria sp. PMC 1051.18]|nr:hypothetical protein [Oscillatoria sp. PMC 1050.18]MEC5031847.1 hypothetical protein [Oscillatoria sp. PMC 1051.18]
MQVVSLNPHHFGAWHGLGLCYPALGYFRPAMAAPTLRYAAFEKALSIQPFAAINQKLILECTLHLS